MYDFVLPNVAFSEIFLRKRGYFFVVDFQKTVYLQPFYGHVTHTIPAFSLLLQESHEDSGLSSSFEETVVISEGGGDGAGSSAGDQQGQSKQKTKKRTKKRTKTFEMTNDLIFDLDIWTFFHFFITNTPVLLIINYCEKLFLLHIYWKHIEREHIFINNFILV